MTLSGAPTAGNLIIAYVRGSSVVMTAINGFALLTLPSAGTLRARLLWKVSDGTETATVAPATFDVSSAWGCFVSEWNNPNGWPVNPVQSDNAQAVSSTTSYTTPTLSPSADVDNVVAAGYATVGAGRTWSAEAFSGSNVGSVTEEGDAASAALATAAISTVTGNYQGSATLSSAGNGGDSIAIFKPNPATKAPPPWQRRWRYQTRRRIS